MFQIEKTIDISAGHRLPGHDQCCYTHGHNYKVTVVIVAEDTLEDHMVFDFNEVDKIIEQFDHKYLNDLSYFNEALPPTTENLAQVIHEEIECALVERFRNSSAENFNDYVLRCIEVRIKETDNSEVIYRPYVHLD